MSWKTATRAVAIAVSMAIVGLSLPTDAFADHRGKRHYKGHHYGGHHHGRKFHRGPRHGGVVYYGPRHRHKKHYRRHRRNDAGVAVAAGIIGLTVGALIASSANNHYYRQAPRRVYRQPRQVYHGGGRPQPFSDPWYRGCAAKYRSFDYNTGTFMSYSGVRKLCRL